MEFVLKDGSGITDGRRLGGPPFLACFGVAPDRVPILREKAPLLLRTFGGDARRFLESILEAGTFDQPGIREIAACALVAMSTDTPERLEAAMSGRAQIVGYVVTRDRMRELASVSGQIRSIPGSGLALSPAATPKWVFRYLCRYQSAH